MRELKKGKGFVKSLSVSGDAIDWLRQQAKAGDVLLAHQDDGVVWGKAHKDGDWVTSDAVLSTSPALEGDRLWSARLFNAQREILLWRDGDGDWQAREISDGASEGEPDFTEWYDEPQLLWGDHGKHKKVVGDVTFAVLEEGAQGLRHAPPIELPFDAHGSLGSSTRACVLVRHYLAKEDVARVIASRLVRLDCVKGNKA
jgi:CRISPR-associated protein (TIGR03984 family)